MANYNHIEQLVQQVQGGDKQAFRELYNSHVQAMLNTARRIVKREDTAEDVIQEAFVKAFLNISKLKDCATFSGWLKRIVINQSMEAVNVKKLDPIEKGNSNETVVKEEKEWWKEIPFSLIEQEILNLPGKSRIVLSLYALEGLTHKEIGAFLKVSESTSKSQYRYALKCMKTALIKIKEYEI